MFTCVSSTIMFDVDDTFDFSGSRVGLLNYLLKHQSI